MLVQEKKNVLETLILLVEQGAFLLSHETTQIELTCVHLYSFHYQISVQMLLFVFRIKTSRWGKGTWKKNEILLTPQKKRDKTVHS